MFCKSLGCVILTTALFTGTCQGQSKPKQGSKETQAEAKALIDRFTKEFEALVKDDKHVVKLREAAELLESTNESDRWTNYSAALKILRQHRSKAAIPLIMKYMIKHSTFSTGASAMKSYTETLSVLSGRELTNPYRYQADRFTPVVVGVKKMAETWWNKNSKTLAVDIDELSEEQLLVIVHALLKKQRWNSNYLRDPSGNHDPTAYRLYHVLFYDIMGRSSSSRERAWRAEELSPAMVPILLKIAGYQKEPPKEQARDSMTIPFEMVHMLAWMRKNDQAPQLDKIAEDTRQNSAVRLVCILALFAADEKLRADTLITMLKSEKKIERRLTIILALQQSRNTKKVLPTLLAQLDDPNGEIRSAAIYALHNHASNDILPRLQEMLDELDPPGAVDNVLDVIGEMQTAEAQAALIEFMREGLKTPAGKKLVPDALGAFATATDKRWYEAGAHPQEYYLEQAVKAIKWWDSQASLRKPAPSIIAPAAPPTGLVKSGNRAVDETRTAVRALMSKLDQFQLKLTYRGPQPKLYSSVLLSVPPIDPLYSHEMAQILKAEAILIICHLAGNGFLFRGGVNRNKPNPYRDGSYYEFEVTNGKDVYRDILPWAGRTYRWKDQQWSRTFDQIANLRTLLSGRAAQVFDGVTLPLEEMKTSIINRSKRWKAKRVVADFNWLTENAIPIGSPKYHVREILGDPIGKEVKLANGGSYWLFVRNDANKKQFEALSIVFDANGRMTGVGRKPIE
ncbi:MAG: hypothetical protein CMJ78_13260 [Planctomycetaceae bacterium]|nr:hypothetical protein [Planctomycetaceae bacterium]